MYLDETNVLRPSEMQSHEIGTSCCLRLHPIIYTEDKGIVFLRNLYHVYEPMLLQHRKQNLGAGGHKNLECQK
jgi:hypothetical protein